ncbi:MAG: PEP-CTERM sorting domain-containing protein [Rhizonema sp. PD37]|nr:PEP-CTERM sorting domain-containing protein [Rhizonema sp. PD37]
MKRSLTKSTIAASLVLSAAIVSQPAMAAPKFKVTIEAPGVQQSKLTNSSSGATGVFVNNFDSETTGYKSNGLAFAGDSKIGIYDKGDIVAANQYGGAGGTGKFLVVQPGQSGAPATYTQSTLTLTNPQRYFGVWWSAGDKNNELDFFSGNQLLEKFTTADVIKLVNNNKSYYGNPNPKFKGQDSGEPFVFVNFFADPTDTKVTFNKVAFINKLANPLTGFETDNQTIARSYQPVPEPSALLGLGLVAGIGVFSQKRRILKQA